MTPVPASGCFRGWAVAAQGPAADPAGLRRVGCPSAVVILQSAEGIPSSYLGDDTGRGQPINPAQPVLGSFLHCFKTLNICMEREEIFWQQPLIKVSLVRRAYRSAPERYFCWRTPPGGALERRQRSPTAALGSPGTASPPARGACPALGAGGREGGLD